MFGAKGLPYKAFVNEMIRVDFVWKHEKKTLREKKYYKNLRV